MLLYGIIWSVMRLTTKIFKLKEPLEDLVVDESFDATTQRPVRGLSADEYGACVDTSSIIAPAQRRDVT